MCGMSPQMIGVECLVRNDGNLKDIAFDFILVFGTLPFSPGIDGPTLLKCQ